MKILYAGMKSCTLYTLRSEPFLGTATKSSSIIREMRRNAMFCEPLYSRRYVAAAPWSEVTLPSLPLAGLILSFVVGWQGGPYPTSFPPFCGRCSFVRSCLLNRILANSCSSCGQVCKVHQRLPNGGILVFLTGKREILHMCDKLRREFPPPRAPRKRDHRSGCDTENDDVADATREEEGPEEVTDSEKHQAKGKKRRRRSGKGANISHTDTENDKEAMKAEPKSREKPIETDRETLLFREADDDEEDAARLADMEGRQESDRDDITTAGDGGAVAAEREGKVDEHLSDASDDNDDDDDGAAVGVLPPVHVVPLYAMLTAEEQAKVFRPPPDGHRLVVVATNVAETSITIPGISYVVDSGRQKRRVVQRGSGISQFEVGWVSKASADQRAGRAGRTGPGHCYRWVRRNKCDELTSVSPGELGGSLALSRGRICGGAFLSKVRSTQRICRLVHVWECLR